MGSRIVDLKSIRFCGRRLTRRRISDIQRTVELFPSLSRNELASGHLQSSWLADAEGRGKPWILSTDAARARDPGTACGVRDKAENQCRH